MDNRVEIYNKFGGFPLVLTQVASCVNDNLVHSFDFQFNDFIQQYENLLKNPFPDDFLTPNKQTAFAAVSLNIDRIKSEDSKRLLIYLTYLNKSKIDLKLLKTIFNNDILFSSLRELKKFSLILFQDMRHQHEEILTGMCFTYIN